MQGVEEVALAAGDPLEDRLLRRLPSTRTILAVGAGYLLIAWGLVVAIDVLDVGGLRSRLGRDTGAPVWVHLFSEASPTEWVQTIFLFGAVMSLAVMIGLAIRDASARWAGFGAWLSLGLLLMLFEDTGNVGQRLSGYVADLVGADSRYVDLARVPILLLAGGVPLYALWRYRRLLREHLGAPVYLLLAGFATYGFMAVTSEGLTLDWGGNFDFYGQSGDLVLRGIFNDRLVLLGDTTVASFEGFSRRDTASFFMDYVYEESLELIGSMLIAAGCVLLLRRFLQGGPERIDRGPMAHEQLP